MYVTRRLVSSAAVAAATSSSKSSVRRTLVTTSSRLHAAAATNSTSTWDVRSAQTNTSPSSSSSSSTTTTASSTSRAAALLANAVNQRCFSSYSSISEPNPTLFAPSFTAAGDDDNNNAADSPAASATDAPLRNDIRVMGSLLGKIIRENEGESIFGHVEDLRALAQDWRTAPDEATAEGAFAKLSATVADLSDKELYTITRAFTHFLALANAAEFYHRVRRLGQIGKSAAATDDDMSGGALYTLPDSCGGVMPSLLGKGHSVDEIWEALTTQTTEFVLTAHPTEVNRRTILDKKRRIQELLTKADLYRDVGSSDFEKDRLDQALYTEITSIWLSDEVARIKPTPETEAEKGTLVLETVLWETVPLFLRKLDATAQEFLGKGLPMSSAPIKFASWMGGDRDGNPNVKANTTRTVCMRNRAKAASLFRRDLQRLYGELSINLCADEIKAVVGDKREPYRAYLQNMIDKMARTEAWAIAQQPDNKNMDGSSISVDEIYLSKKELMDEFELIYRDLYNSGHGFAAEGILTDMMRNLSAFGLTLIPLDVRQESDRHEEAVDSITRYLGLGSYSQWDEQTRINWLVTQISSKRPLLRKGAIYDNPEYFSPTAVDTLETFQMVSEQYEGSLGAYVISQATSASDVLAVLLLQLDAGVQKPLRIAPLFETLSDLEGATSTMRTLFSLPAYMGIIKGKQEVMIGYSDSAKDAGRLAASWAQYETQEKLSELAREFNIDMTFFHGKGGTAGRGGNPQTFIAINAHAPDTINGHFRVTEQGEMINQSFGFGPRAERTLDIYTAAVLAEKLTDRPKPSDDWRAMMGHLSDVSCDKYREVVRHDERFVPYFRSATPELELASLNIGSRPAKRKATGGVESLRAIPWNFAWTQTRFNLPTWLGVGTAIGGVLKSEKAGVLRDMYENWGSFRAMIDVVEMVLAKSEPRIAKHYDDILVSDEAAKSLGNEVRGNHLETEEAILDLTKHAELGENNKTLMRAIKVRNRYVDCLNILQAETLQRLRKFDEGEEDKLLKDTLLVSITGVANGMGNTG